MKKKFLLFLSLAMALSLVSCNPKTEESKPELSEWQKNVMLSENLPLDEEQLTELQKTRLNSIFEMENYLREKYNEEFVYVEYWPAELLESEKLIVYPQMTGDGNGKNIVTVKRDQNGKLTDDYYDYSVAEYAEKLIYNYVSDYFQTDDFLYYSSTNACSIKKTEIIDGDFCWKYGSSNRFFLKKETCNIDTVEKFATDYANFLYEHKISGKHRINILNDFSKSEFDENDYREWESDEIGSYSFSFNSAKTKVFYACLIYDGDIWESSEIDLDEYLTKYK